MAFSLRLSLRHFYFYRFYHKVTVSDFICFFFCDENWTLSSTHCRFSLFVLFGQFCSLRRTKRGGEAWQGPSSPRIYTSNRVSDIFNPSEQLRKHGLLGWGVVDLSTWTCTMYKRWSLLSAEHKQITAVNYERNRRRTRRDEFDLWTATTGNKSVNGRSLSRASWGRWTVQDGQHERTLIYGHVPPRSTDWGARRARVDGKDARGIQTARCRAVQLQLMQHLGLLKSICLPAIIPTDHQTRDRSAEKQWILLKKLL